MNQTTIDFAFVILHYVTFDITVECVDNLIKLFKDNNILIVIVDNASPNGSGKKLKDKYQNNSKVIVILHNKNDGFARGNNVGFKYLRQNYEVKFMIVMNNDILIQNNLFLEKTEEIYQKFKFDVLGPDIIVYGTNWHQNPHGYTIPTDEDCLQGIQKLKKYIREENFRYYKLLILHYGIYIWAKPLIKTIFPKIYNKINQKIHSSKQTDEQNNNKNNKISDIQEGIILHGSCYIFSHKYIKQRDYAFYPETFMYGEEIILALQCAEEGYKTIYNPDEALKVIHKCHTSINRVFSDNHKQCIFRWKQHIRSFKTYIKLFNEYKLKNQPSKK